jgi:hypothetical protein
MAASSHGWSKHSDSGLPVPNLVLQRQTVVRTIDLWSDVTGGGLTCNLYGPPLVIVNDIDPDVMADRADNKLRLEVLAYAPPHRGKKAGVLTIQNAGFRHPSNQNPASSPLVTGPTRGGARSQGSLPTAHTTAWAVIDHAQTIPVWETIGGLLYRQYIFANGIDDPIEVIANHYYRGKASSGGVFGYTGKLSPLKLRFRYAKLADTSDPHSWISGAESQAVWISHLHHPFIPVAPTPGLPHKQNLVMNPNFSPKDLKATLGTLLPS